MNVRALILCLLWPFGAFGAFAQGFSGLGTSADGFATPQPNPEFSFPADHGAHPEFRIEWWYLTANLTAADGTDYGLQWTLFRSALAPTEGEGWQSPQVWFAHAAVTTPKRHFATERFARGGIGQAGVQVDPFDAWIDEWSLKGESFDEMSLTANGPDFGYSMALNATGPLVFHGDKGLSIKSADGQGSYYYSQPFYEIEGVLKLPDGDVPVTGSAWLDREWSSQPLSDTQSGWDWFSLSFSEGSKVMGFQVRQADGTEYSSSTWINADGTTVSYPDGAFAAEPVTMTKVEGREIPTEWHVTLPEKGVNVTVKAINEQAWMGLSIPYWEGPVSVTGSHDGHGYLEMTGYE
ncbi:MAG: lipocalin-like domain-containing protein [Marinosulfonomonas sp.]